MTLRRLSSASVWPEEGAADPRHLVTDRKVLRLLTPLATPPLVAAVRAYDAVPQVAPERTSVHTVSGWEESGTASVTRPGRSTTPTAELQRMTTLPLCVITLARRLRGPNAHWVGDGVTLSHVLGLVEHELASGAADRSLVVAFDLVGEGPSSCAAAAALLALDGDAGPGHGSAAISPSSPTKMTALTALPSLTSIHNVGGVSR
jgi:hypothetical protein